MSRAAIRDALINDVRLQALGLDKDSILVNYDGEQRPNDSLFIVIGWMPDTNAVTGDDVFRRDYKNFTVWVHIYQKESTDFDRIDSILNILDDIYLNMIHVEGADGYTVTLVEGGTRSRDMKDDAYQTICRSASYRILSRET